jgi:CBS domain containing-hemolysin-like protein
MDAYSWLGLLVLLVALTLIAFVAAAEAGLITISRARVRLMAGRGVPRAEMLERYVQEREALLRALSLARNLAIVVAGAVGAALLTRQEGHHWALIALVIIGALALIAVLEAVPRFIVARSPESWGLRLAPFMGTFKLLFGMPARLLDLPIRAVLRGRAARDESEEEMLRFIELEENEGEIEEDERKMIRGVFGLEDTTVREIMTPRPDIVAVEASAPPAEVVKLIVDRGLSRIPVYKGSIDNIIGIAYAKDLIRYLADGRLPEKLTDIVRAPFFVPDSKRIDDLLTDMRKRRVHMAVVIDEYGGTAGIATIEDLIEEIVGEIEDEHDRVQQPIIRVSEREAILDGRVSIDELNEMFDTHIDDEDYDTVGGCVFHILGRMPVVGDEAVADGVRLRVLALDGHRITRIRATLEERVEPDLADGNGRNGH